MTIPFNIERILKSPPKNRNLPQIIFYPQNKQKLPLTRFPPNKRKSLNQSRNKLWIKVQLIIAKKNVNYNKFNFWRWSFISSEDWSFFYLIVFYLGVAFILFRKFLIYLGVDFLVKFELIWGSWFWGYFSIYLGVPLNPIL